MTRAYTLTQRSMNPKDDTAAPMPVEADELTKYELMMIFKPDMNQDETDKELNKIRKEIKDFKGEIYHEDIWDVRDLAYIIKKYDKGYYVIFYFTLDASNIKELERDFHLNQKLLRYLIVKSPKNYEMKKLEDLMINPEDEKKPQVREERPRRGGPRRDAPRRPEYKPKTVEKTEEKPKIEPKEEPKVEAKPEPKEELKVEKKPMDISDLDSKLESILDDPDIDIKL